MDVLARLDEARAAANVLEHPFYVRWSAGELTPEELGRYAAQYRHAVVALAHATGQAAESADDGPREELERHAQEEAAHVSLWDRFAEETGAPAGGEPAVSETATCVRTWTAGEDLLEQLAVMYVIEASQPAISRTKLDGLAAHYGFSEEGPATEYFRVHELRDVEHAREARELIERLLDATADREGTGERMLARASAALRGNWLLLDGVEGAPPG